MTSVSFSNGSEVGICYVFCDDSCDRSCDGTFEGCCKGLNVGI